jgi:pSer/pThr/pTyr-binding forkhead associated (FHA) protein
LRIGVKKREVEIPLDKVIHLGRLSPALDVFPEIDLTDQGIFAASVSRRHARISKRGATVVIEDMDSGNGTYINGQRLSPYLPETLSDGDTLQLGQLPIEVKFLMYR